MHFNVLTGFICLTSYCLLWTGSSNSKSIHHQLSPIVFEHLNADELSNRYVTSILRDRQNFIWIGTTEGLFRYDGYEMKHYRRLDRLLGDGTHNAVAVDIWFLFQDSQGIIWISTHGSGLVRFDPGNETLTRYQSGPDWKTNPYTISAGIVTRMIEDSPGRYWLGSSVGGLSYFKALDGFQVGGKMKFTK